MRLTATLRHTDRRVRGVIVDAAIKVFSSQGFSDASIHDIADEAGVAPTAVYYHFSGKPDLFEAALRRVLGSITSVVITTRSDEEPGSPEALAAVISAVWKWLDENPESCELLYHHLPGMTTRAVTLQREFEEIHLRRAFDYIPQRPPTTAPFGDQPARRGDVGGAHVDRPDRAHPSDARPGRSARRTRQSPRARGADQRRPAPARQLTSRVRRHAAATTDQSAATPRRRADRRSSPVRAARGRPPPPHRGGDASGRPLHRSRLPR